MDKIRIDAPGSLFGALIIEDTPNSCGKVVAGIGARLEGARAGFVLSWEDFEAAYLALKAERETAKFAVDAKWQRDEHEKYKHEAEEPNGDPEVPT